VTHEEQRIYDAAKRYAITASDRNLGELVTVVYNLPLIQWPDNACPPLWTPDCADEELSAEAHR